MRAVQPECTRKPRAAGFMGPPGKKEANEVEEVREVEDAMAAQCGSRRRNVKRGLARGTRSHGKERVGGTGINTEDAEIGAQSSRRLLQATRSFHCPFSPSSVSRRRSSCLYADVRSSL